MKNNQSTYQACHEYPEQSVARLLELPLSDPERYRWEAHAGHCDSCNSLLKADKELIEVIRLIPDPAPVWVRASVMSRISGKRKSRLFRLGDFAWGSSAAFAGVFLGLLLVWNDESGVQFITISKPTEEIASLTVTDDIDTFIADLAEDQGD